MTVERLGSKQVESAWRRFALLYLTIIALGVGTAFAFSDRLYWWWVERFQGPALADEFGFVVERQTISIGAATYSALVIVDVQKGGRFAAAGVQANDVVACLYHGPADFWGKLQAVQQGEQVTIRVLQRASVSGGCDAARSVVLTPDRQPDAPGRPTRG